MDFNGLSIISSLQGSPIELDKPHILASVAETSFLRFKEQVSFNFKIKYQWFNGNGRPLDLYNLRPLLVSAGQYL
jgi:hypothetical protein